MKKVMFRGPVLTQSGYGVHSRQIARWLLSRQDLNVCFQPMGWGQTPWIVNRTAYDGLINTIYERSVDITTKGYDVAITLGLPNEFDTSLGRINVGMTAGVETDRCNPQWSEACSRMSCIVCPSSHSLKSLNVPQHVPAFVIPEAVSDACLVKHEIDLNVSSTFNFLVFGQITGDNPFNDRKNTFFTLKWLIEEFKNDKDVGIILKTNAGRNTVIDRNSVVDVVKKLVNEIGRGVDGPRIHLLHGEMSDEDVVGLYRNDRVKALVSATRGEGFGLPLLEASACGLPVIATGWSGHMDFMKKGKFVELYYNLTDVHSSRIDNNIFVQGAKWAEVVESDFKKKIRKFYTSSSTPKEWAANLSEVIKRDHSFESIRALYDKTLKEFV